MTQIQNMNPMPGALGGLGANNPAYAGRKDGAPRHQQPSHASRDR